MRVKTESANPGLLSILINPDQVITIDANFFIAPDRSRLGTQAFSYLKFQEIWLEPLFIAFSKLAIHEAVYSEFNLGETKGFVDNKIALNPGGLIIFSDSKLTKIESMLRDTIEKNISKFTKYDISRDNRDDRGEVKSLAYIAVKNLLYFASNDSTAIMLIEESTKLSTSLDNVQALKMYELIYYLYNKNLSNPNDMKMLYKYLYYLTPDEKKNNPEWGKFVQSMDSIYLLLVE